jgi:hypothetical protein
MQTQDHWMISRQLDLVYSTPSERKCDREPGIRDHQGRAGHHRCAARRQADRRTGRSGIGTAHPRSGRSRRKETDLGPERHQEDRQRRRPACHPVPLHHQEGGRRTPRGLFVSNCCPAVFSNAARCSAPNLLDSDRRIPSLRLEEAHLTTDQDQPYGGRHCAKRLAVSAESSTPPPKWMRR